jgi:ribonuclease G
VTEEILINVTPRETRVAVVENGMLQEVHVERALRRGYVGNIYKGRVSRVMPGMQAAFVEIGLERAAFLHASDILRAMPALLGESNENGNGTPPVSPPIAELVRDGQDIVVQVVKDPIGSKGARLTTNLSVPSRYLVLLPYVKVVGVSVRIEDETERSRLKTTPATSCARMPKDSRAKHCRKTWRISPSCGNRCRKVLPARAKAIACTRICRCLCARCAISCGATWKKFASIRAKPTNA